MDELSRFLKCTKAENGLNLLRSLVRRSAKNLCRGDYSSCEEGFRYIDGVFPCNIEIGAWEPRSSDALLSGRIFTL